MANLLSLSSGNQLQPGDVHVPAQCPARSVSPYPLPPLQPGPGNAPRIRGIPGCAGGAEPPHQQHHGWDVPTASLPGKHGPASSRKLPRVSSLHLKPSIGDGPQTSEPSLSVPDDALHQIIISEGARVPAGVRSTSRC